jgi:dTDP-4-amino-4,6-dideoxygalactose transaminase
VPLRLVGSEMCIRDRIEGVDVFSVPNDDYFANYWLSAITIVATKTNGITSETLRLALEAANIESRPLWKPMHLQPIFENYPYYGGKISEELFENGLCLPSGSSLTVEDRKRIKNVIVSIFN